jgi:hypothetical protein
VRACVRMRSLLALAAAGLLALRTASALMLLATALVAACGLLSLASSAAATPPANGVGIATCTAKAGKAHQAWAELSEQPQSQIRTLDGAGCVSAAGCAARSPTCFLAAEPCNASDAFQRFSYNASTGVVHVPPGAAGPKVPPSDPQCWNVWGNKRSSGFMIDVFTCGGEVGPDAVRLQQRADGRLRLRGLPSLCVTVGVDPSRPSPPPPPPRDPELDCALRLLALEMASANLPSSVAAGLSSSSSSSSSSS